MRESNCMHKVLLGWMQQQRYNGGVVCLRGNWNHTWPSAVDAAMKSEPGRAFAKAACSQRPLWNGHDGDMFSL